MATVFVDSVISQNDEFIVRGTVDGVNVQAHGWISAITNYYPPSAYLPDGHLIAGVNPRRMTDAERLNYFANLLRSELYQPPSQLTLEIQQTVTL